MPGIAEIEVKGLRELQVVLRKGETVIHKELNKELRILVKPVAEAATGLAYANIRNIGGKWSRFRVGVTMSTVYLAPKQRGQKRGPQGRPNLGPLLLERAMYPAAEAHMDEIAAGVESMLERVFLS